MQYITITLIAEDDITSKNCKKKYEAKSKTYICFIKYNVLQKAIFLGYKPKCKQGYTLDRVKDKLKTNQA